jgi:hypothetical protein
VRGPSRDRQDRCFRAATRRARWTYEPIWMRCRSKRPTPASTAQEARNTWMLAVMTAIPRCCTAPLTISAETRDFDGTVHFIFQPAEEGLGGAEAMVWEGMLDNFPCDAIFGMHNAPGLAVGKFAIRAGPMMAGSAFRHLNHLPRGAQRASRGEHRSDDCRQPYRRGADAAGGSDARDRADRRTLGVPLDRRIHRGFPGRHGGRAVARRRGARPCLRRAK